MPKHKTITEAAAKRFKAPERGQVDHFDQSYPGLHLRVGARLKTWGYYCRVSGKLKRITLDNYPPMTVAEAHDAWRTARDTVRSGRDPSRAAATADVFENVFKEWMQRDQAENKSAHVVEQIFKREILPTGDTFQSRTLDDVSVSSASIISLIRAKSSQLVVCIRSCVASFSGVSVERSSRPIRSLRSRSPGRSRSATAFSPMTSWPRCGELRDRLASPTDQRLSC